LAAQQIREYGNCFDLFHYLSTLILSGYNVGELVQVVSELIYANPPLSAALYVTKVVAN